MIKFDKVVLGLNIKALREAIGISQLDFSILLDISKRSVANIEAGLTNISAELLASICTFYNLNFNDLADRDLKIPVHYRENIIECHKNNELYHSILNKQPNIAFSIDHKLLTGDFLNTPREITEIKIFFEGLGCYYMGTSISNALKRASTSIKIEPHLTKKGTFVYSKKRIDV